MAPLKSPVGWMADSDYSKLGGAERGLIQASARVGVKEERSNRGPWIARFLGAVGLGVGYAWCAAFVYWCLIQAGVNPLKLPSKRLAASVAQWLKWGRKTGRLIVDPEDAKRGDLMLYPNGSSHVGIVAEIYRNQVDGRLWYRGYEGNTNSRGSREGTSVLEKRRPIDPQMKFISMRGL